MNILTREFDHEQEIDMAGAMKHSIMPYSMRLWQQSLRLNAQFACQIQWPSPSLPQEKCEV